MKKMWNGFKIALSMYSKLPVSKSEWTQENMSHAFIFFPWIGALIGIIVYGIFELKGWSAARGIEISEMTFTVLMVLVPVGITGGIHMDGFLDTRDALCSYQERERKLEILKDPHTGAFAVIYCTVYFLCIFGIYASFGEMSVRAAAFGFVLSRTLSALSVLTFPKAKKSGLAAAFSDSASKKTVKAVLVCYLAILCLAMVAAGKAAGGAAVLAAAAVYVYYRRMSFWNFGGITGDLAGYFLQLCELWMAAAAVGAEMITRCFNL